MNQTFAKNYIQDLEMAQSQPVSSNEITGNVNNFKI